MNSEIETFLRNIIDRKNWINGNSADGWFAKRDIIQWAEEILKKNTPKQQRQPKGVWEIPGEIGPNGCYPDPSEIDQGGIDAQGNSIE